jgi:Kef-type K+ transport system membrane component KefB
MLWSLGETRPTRFSFVKSGPRLLGMLAAALLSGFSTAYVARWLFQLDERDLAGWAAVGVGAVAATIAAFSAQKASENVSAAHEALRRSAERELLARVIPVRWSLEPGSDGPTLELLNDAASAAMISRIVVQLGSSSEETVVLLGSVVAPANTTQAYAVLRPVSVPSEGHLILEWRTVAGDRAWRGSAAFRHGRFTSFEMASITP